MFEKFSEKQRYQWIIGIFFIIFVISFKGGNTLYTKGIAGTILLSIIMSVSSNIFMFMMYPVSLIFQFVLPTELPGVPIALPTIIMLGCLYFMITEKLNNKKKYPIDYCASLTYAMILLLFILTAIHGLPISFKNYRLMHFLESGILFFIISRRINSEKRLKVMSWILVFLSLAISVKLFSYTTLFEQAFFGFENNNLSRQLSFIIPFMLGLFWAEKNNILKSLIIITMAFTAQSLIQLGSRATYISLFIALSLMSLRNIKKRSIWLFGILGVILLIVSASDVIIEEFDSIFEQGFKGENSEEASISGRYWALRQGFGLFMDSPIFGHGPGYFERAMYHKTGVGMNAHNSYIEIMASWGISGILIYLSMFYFSLVNLWKAQKKLIKNKYVYNVAQGCFFGIVAIMINQFMINGPWEPMVWLGFGLSSALYYLSFNKDITKEIN
jgi:O-antigen ligase